MSAAKARSAVIGDLGDGPICSEDEKHGRTVTMQKSQRLWCPVTQTLFAPATFDERVNGFVPGPVVRKGYVMRLVGGSPTGVPASYFDDDTEKLKGDE